MCVTNYSNFFVFCKQHKIMLKTMNIVFSTSKYKLKKKNANSFSYQFRIKFYFKNIMLVVDFLIIMIML